MPIEQAASSAVQDQAGKKATSLRVRVVDNTQDGRPPVTINVPIGVAKWGMKMAKAFSPEMKDLDLDWDSITAMIDEGASGKLVEVQDEAEHKTIEVWVE